MLAKAVEPVLFVEHRIQTDGRDDAESQHSIQLIFALSRQNLYLLRFFQHALRLVNNSFSQLGQSNAVPTPLENRGTQFVLQLFDREAQRRLSYERLFRGTTEVSFLCHGDDILQFRQSHRSASQ